MCRTLMIPSLVFANMFLISTDLMEEYDLSILHILSLKFSTNIRDDNNSNNNNNNNDNKNNNLNMDSEKRKTIC